VTAIHDRLARREQTLILLNRRGFSTFVLCRSCGEQIVCRRCSIGMTLHRRESIMRCHYCDDRRPVPDRCPACGGAHMHFGGTGTERLEAHLRELYPNARVERMDRDTVGSRGAAERILTRVERGEVDILLGTQMISKGHDFPNVTLVGVVGADALLGLPDFRAAERTYQLLSQVAGRSGRRTRSGQVIIQAYDAGHHAIAAACRHDFAGFAHEELRYRRIMNYPPFTALALVLIRHRDQETAHAGAAALAQRLRACGGDEIQVFGPAPAPLERLRGKYRVQILLKGSTRRSVQTTLAAMLHEEGESGRAVGDRVIDVDPMSTM
jgi:primosomal protein N' (replication factor Y)